MDPCGSMISIRFHKHAAPALLRHSDGLTGCSWKANLVSTFLMLTVSWQTASRIFSLTVFSFFHWCLLVPGLSLLPATEVPARQAGDLSGVSEIPLCPYRPLDLRLQKCILWHLHLYAKCFLLNLIGSSPPYEVGADKEIKAK